MSDRDEYFAEYRNREEVKKRLHEYYLNHPKILVDFVAACKEMKVRLINYKGGLCSVCGIIATDDNACIFDFHHLDPTEKERRVGNSVNWEISKAEADKCILLCSNCHRMIHRR